MAPRDILAIGTSAGGISALRALTRSFDESLEASVLITIHLSPHFNSGLDVILSRDGPLPVAFATDGEALEKNFIYLAPPERHLLVQDGHLVLGEGPRENNARPAIDPMFRSVAACCGHRSVGLVLTGTLGDGASGLQALQQSGALTIVQDPNDAEFPEMPIAALRRVNPHQIAKLSELPEVLRKLLKEPAGRPRPAPADLRFEVEIAKTGNSSMRDMEGIGDRSVLTCPDCHGIMWQIRDGDLVRYRCHLGHAYSAEVLQLALDENLRRALASALRSLEERSALSRTIHDEEVASGSRRSATWAKRAAAFEREAEVIRASVRRLDEIASKLDRALAKEDSYAG